MEMKKLTVRVKKLVATHIDRASSENEKDASYEHACRFIEKKFGCERWVASCVFAIMIDRPVIFEDGDKYRPKNGHKLVIDTLNKLGIKHSVSVNKRRKSLTISS